MNQTDSDDLQNLTRFGTPRKRRASEIVYFLQAAQLRLIKIGVASDLARRIGNLRTGCPDDLVILGVIRPADRAAALVEQEIHAQFWAHHHHGEWFNPAPALLDFIATNTIGGAEDEDRARWDAACICLGAIGGGRVDVRYPGAFRTEPEAPCALSSKGVVTQTLPQREPVRRRSAGKPRGSSKERLAAYKAARGIA